VELFEAGVFRDELKSEDSYLIKRAALFHDIGKIGVSDMILLKRGPLTSEEYREVQDHTIIGAMMLDLIYSRAPTEHYLKVASIIAGGHHEHFDGTGYPHGLAGDNIPLCCRIMAVANVYDACVTDRVYRKKLSHEQACQVILEGRGTEFDPRIVDVFSRIQDKFAFVQTTSYFPSQDPQWRFYHEANPGC
jgi:putative two-component system response regulator